MRGPSRCPSHYPSRKRKRRSRITAFRGLRFRLGQRRGPDDILPGIVQDAVPAVECTPRRREYHAAAKVLHGLPVGRRPLVPNAATADNLQGRTLPQPRVANGRPDTVISISLEAALLEEFDQVIAAKQYATRSEAIRDLIRDRLLREETKHQKGEQVAVVTPGARSPRPRAGASRLIDMQHHHHDVVVSSMHVHLGLRHCLEVSVLRGPAHEVIHLGEELLATKGVLHGEITYTGGSEPSRLG